MNQGRGNYLCNYIDTEKIKDDFKEDFVNSISRVESQWGWLGHDGLAGAGTVSVLYLGRSLWIIKKSAEEQRLFKYRC